MNNFSILVDCPDSYFDLLNIFLKYLSINWPESMSKLFVTTNNNSLNEYPDVRFIKCGNDLNSIQRSNIALPLIKTNYVIILDCDCFVSKPVCNSEIENLISYVESQNIQYVKLWKTKNKEQKIYHTDYPNLFFCNKKARYSMSLMANIWDKQAYIDNVISLNIDGWNIEKKWLSDSLHEKERYNKSFCYYDNDPLHILHGVAKGRWIRKSLRAVLRIGIFSKKDISRKKCSLLETVKQNISTFFKNHFSSKTVRRLKHLVGRKRFVTDN